MTLKTNHVVIALLAVFTTAMLDNAYATNSEPWYWSSATQYYGCTTSLDGIAKTNNVNPCSDLTASANVWNNISGSTWNLSSSSGGWPVYAWNNYLPSNTLGETTVAYLSPSGIAQSAYIVMNKDKAWEDSTVDTQFHAFDWKSATGHEFGHLAGIAHNTSTSSVMYTPLGQDTVRRIPNSHDQSVLAGKY
jgi:hypothetical protein